MTGLKNLDTIWRLAKNDQADIFPRLIALKLRSKDFKEICRVASLLLKSYISLCKLPI